MSRSKVKPGRHRKRKLKVFLCHAKEDKTKVTSLYRRLERDGVQPWFDERDLLAGEDWESEIRKAVRSSDVVAVCLSRRSIRKRGFYQSEIKIALNEADRHPQGAVFIMPLRFDNCDVPDDLKRWQYLDLFRNQGYAQLMVSLSKKAKNSGCVEPKRSSAVRRASNVAWTAAAIPIPVRAQGMCERTSDIVLVPSVALKADRTVDIRVFLNTNITTPLIARSRSMLALEEMTGQAGSTGPVTGRMDGVNSVLFEGVRVRKSTLGALRITNVRVNAAQLGVASGGRDEPVFAYVSFVATTGARSPIVVNPQVQIGSIRHGSSFQLLNGEGTKVDGPRVFSRTVGLNSGMLDSSIVVRPSLTFRLRFLEGHPKAFKTRCQELGAATVFHRKVLTSGTRFLVMLGDVPENVHVFVTSHDAPSPEHGWKTPQALLVSTEADYPRRHGSTVASPPSPVVGVSGEGIPLVELPVKDKCCSAVWEWVNDDPNSPMEVRAIDFGLLIAAKAGFAGGGTSSIITSLAPLSDVTRASLSAPVPRFLDVSTEHEAFCFSGGLV